MTKKLLLATLLTLCCTAQGMAQGVSSLVQKTAAEVRTLTANFKQTRQLTVMTKPVESSGKLYFSAPSNVRWEQTLPTKMVIAFDGQKAYIMNKNGAVKEFAKTSNQMLKALNDIIAGGVSGSIFAEHQNYTIKFDKTTSGQNRARLEPRNVMLKKYIESLEIIFDKQLQAKQITIREKAGDQTTIRLENTIVNAPLANELFILK